MIDKFDGEYAFLSNFYHSPILVDNKEYDTVEHFFQATKAVHKGDAELIRKQPTPGKAKRMGRRVELREDWETVKVAIMRSVVHQKFLQHIDLGQKLKETGDEELIEGNDWGDTFWGVCNGVGDNQLGKILMEVRDYLREDEDLSNIKSSLKGKCPYCGKTLYVY